MTEIKEYGKILRDARLSMKINVKAAASEIGVYPDRLERLEKGEGRKLTGEELQRAYELYDSDERIGELLKEHRGKRAASIKYEKKFSTAKLRMDKEEHQRLLDHAKRRGVSMNEYVLLALRKEFENDNIKGIGM
jgi:transcriptional regulator with XRE-family HTH domain